MTISLEGEEKIRAYRKIGSDSVPEPVFFDSEMKIIGVTRKYAHKGPIWGSWELRKRSKNRAEFKDQKVWGPYLRPPSHRLPCLLFAVDIKLTILPNRFSPPPTSRRSSRERDGTRRRAASSAVSDRRPPHVRRRGRTASAPGSRRNPSPRGSGRSASGRSF
jgi:hypothetical protein